VRHVKGEQNIESLYERFMQKEHLRMEFATILQNFKQQYIHFIRALLNNSISALEFRERIRDLRELYTNAFREFNTFYKKKYHVCMTVSTHMY
jgi:hypothetical protein